MWIKKKKNHCLIIKANVPVWLVSVASGSLLAFCRLFWALLWCFHAVNNLCVGRQLITEAFSQIQFCLFGRTLGWEFEHQAAIASLLFPAINEFRWIFGCGLLPNGCMFFSVFPNHLRFCSIAPCTIEQNISPTCTSLFTTWKIQHLPHKDVREFNNGSEKLFRSWEGVAKLGASLL